MSRTIRVIPASEVPVTKGKYNWSDVASSFQSLKLGEALVVECADRKEAKALKNFAIRNFRANVVARGTIIYIMKKNESIKNNTRKTQLVT